MQSGDRLTGLGKARPLRRQGRQSAAKPGSWSGRALLGSAAASAGFGRGL